MMKFDLKDYAKAKLKDKFPEELIETVKWQIKQVRTNDLKIKEKINRKKVEKLKKRFLKKIPIPMPIINANNEIIAETSSFIVNKEVGLKKTHVMHGNI